MPIDKKKFKEFQKSFRGEKKTPTKPKKGGKDVKNRKR